MPHPDPIRTAIEATAMLVTARCPACGSVGSRKDRHPYAPKLECKWCEERARIVQRGKVLDVPRK